MHSARRLLAWLPVLAACLFIASCAQIPSNGAAFQETAGAAQPPLLQLPPASLGKVLVEQQRLTISGPAGQKTSLDALLEVDEQSVRLAFLQMGQVVARLEWDGRHLQTTQARQWPKQVSAERILSDLQFARWPLAVVQDALLPPWSMVQVDGTRYLRHQDKDAVLFTRRADGQTDIDYLLSGWRLTIQAHALSTDSRGQQ